MSSFFPNARDFTVTGGNFSHVEGDQHNYMGPITIVQNHIKKRTEFDEFYYVKRGAICRLKNIYIDQYPRRWDDGDRKYWEEGQYRADRTICAARVLEQPGMVFTVAQYSGPEARKAFEDDFRMFSRALTSDVWQMYGYNDSEIPSLVSYNELVPVAHLQENMAELGRMYLCDLHKQLGCKVEELWMDAGRGVFCRGPPGPDTYLSGGDLGIENLPPTAELIKEDVLLRFLASLRSKEVDRAVVAGILHSGAGIQALEQVSQPTVISMSTKTPISMSDNAWNEVFGLSDPMLLENGLTRQS
ncbi:hypothetical protein PQX77_012892 [Marasmius sp. AFHP31]|nr:hypothetical protein PQX77_012892 [Marasmius sp. AFHP31]